MNITHDAKRNLHFLSDGGQELGIIRVVRGGKHGRVLYAAYSARSGGSRWHLGQHSTFEAAARRVAEFAEDPWPFMGRVHRVLAEVVER